MTKPATGAIQNPVQLRARKNKYVGIPKIATPPYAAIKLMTKMATNHDGVDDSEYRYGPSKIGTASGATRKAVIRLFIV